MTIQNIINHSIITAIIAVWCIFSIGCNRIGPSSAAGQEKPNSNVASAEISIDIGQVGTLAKRNNIELSRLIVFLTSPGEDTIWDTTSLSGTIGKTVYLTIGNLAAPRLWELTATVYDQRDSLIHFGSIGFPTFPGDTNIVGLGVLAKYSMLRVSFYGIPDSAKKLSILVDGVVKAESTFTAATHPDTVVLSYDYLPTSLTGTVHTVTCKARGNWYGMDTLLYSVDSVFKALSGEWMGFAMACKWVGPETNLSKGLIAYYPFSGDATDASGNGNDGTVNGATLTEDRFGRADKSYSFNGIDNWIDLGNKSALKIQFPITISVWVKNKILYTYDKALFINDNFLNSYFGIWLAIRKSDTESYFGCGFGDGGAASSAHRISKVANINMDLNVWYHMVAIIKGPAEMDLFLNNTKIEGVISGTGGNLAYSNASGALGRNDGNNPIEYLNGDLDDLRIYNRALTQAEITLLYHENGWTGN
jgi:hypothetical protein